EELLEAVWGDTAVEEGALARCVSLIRKALGDSPRRPRYIETVPKRGYRLMAEVLPVPPDASAEPSEGPSEGPFALKDESRPALPQESSLKSTEPEPEEVILPSPSLAGLHFPRRHQWKAVLVGGFLVALAGVGWLLSREASSPLPTDALAAELQPELPTVAVPAFLNLSKAPEDQWMAESLAELISTELGMSPRVQVIPRELVQRQHVSVTSPAELPLGGDSRLRAALGYDLVLFGSYLLEASPGEGAQSLRLDLKLVDSASGRTLTALVLEGHPEDLSGLAREAGERLRRSLPGTGPTEGRSPPTASVPMDPEAIRLYTDGLLLLGTYQPAAARESLLRSLEVEPKQPYVQLALAEAWTSLGQSKAAARAADTARDLSSSLPANQRLWIEARALSFASRWKEAAEIYRRLWDAYPESLEYGLDLAASLAQARDFRASVEALAEVRGRAGGGDADPRIDLQEARTARMMGEQERAVRAAARAAELAEANGQTALVAQALSLLSASLYASDHPREAVENLDRAIVLYRELGDRKNLAWAEVSLGRWAYHEGELDRAEEHFRAAFEVFKSYGDQRAEALVRRHLAEVAEERGQYAAALEMLEESLTTFRKLGDDFEQAQLLNAVGIAHAGNLDPDAAVAAYQEAHALYGKTGNREMEVITLYNLATVRISQGRVRDALDRFRQSVQSFRDLGNLYAEATAQQTRSGAARIAGELAEAEEAAQQAVEISRRIENHRLLAQSLLEKAQLLSEKDQPEAARGIAAEAQGELEKLGEATYLAESQQVLARLLLASGEGAQAEGAARRALELLRANGAPAATAFCLLARALGVQTRLDVALEALSSARGERDYGFGLEGFEHHLTAARLMAASGDTEGAVELLKTVRKEAEVGGA
ncbi:MAG: tetratricopeptide repeat protein, partial [Acidobacteria bacterium]|nr:tetratricopeptide repeat protein [Acidobacteriota bacterium]